VKKAGPLEVIFTKTAARRITGENKRRRQRAEKQSATVLKKR
jgi:hypothetical protein